MSKSTRRLLLLALAIVGVGLVALYEPWAKFLYDGDGTLSDRSELNRPRYIVTFNMIPIFEVGTYRFHFRRMPHEQMTLVLHIQSPSLHEDELKSLQAAIEVTLVDSRGNDICKSSRRPGLNDQDSVWVLSGREFWHWQCHDFQAHPTESYELTIRVTRADPHSEKIFVTPTLEGGGLEFP
jgi:hypothetical protein